MPQNKAIIDLQAFGDDPAAQRFLLLRYGHTDFTKGREKGGFDFTAEDADAVIANFHDRGKDLVVDYDHATLSGGEAPASGWITSLEKGDDGLYAVADWTPKAAERLKNREYRYHSPVIFFDAKTGHPSALHSVALTNHPSMHGYPALAADDDDFSNIDPTTQKQQENSMNKTLLALASALGIAVEFTDGKEDEAKTAAKISEKITELMTAKAQGDAFLEAQGAKTFDDITGKIAGMKPAADFEKLQAELNALKSKDLVAKAFNDGKLVEAQRAWAEDYAARNPEGFKAFCDNAPKIAPGPATTVPATNPPKTEQPAAFTDADLAIMARLGVKKEDLTDNKEGK